MGGRVDGVEISAPISITSSINELQRKKLVSKHVHPSLALCSLFILQSHFHTNETYIIYVQPPEEVDLLSSKDLNDYYHSFLPSTTTDDLLTPTMVYSYRHALSGFAAKLTPDQITAMRAKLSFIQAHPDRLIPLAVYKVCSADDCQMSDIIAGHGAAVGDGVDIISLSMGQRSMEYYVDPIAIIAFVATQKGIFVSCAVGNSGPSKSSLSNGAPWVLTVGESTIDRSIRATAVRLGEGTELDGETLYQPKDFKPDQHPLVLAGNNTDVKGKVVLCEPNGNIDDIAKGRAVKEAGGAGMIIMNNVADAYTIPADKHVLPAVHVSCVDGLIIKSYVAYLGSSTNNPTATIIFKGTAIENSTRTPTVASFSSRGPSQVSEDVLKPDIIRPGVNVLAAWPFDIEDASQGPTFNIISGTSMSAPHFSGVAALFKSAHPDWSPAMIKSAILTTADKVDHQGKPIADQNLNRANLFATGAGHVNPSKAIDPGLVYDLSPENNISYLCAKNYSDDNVSVIAHKTTRCADYQKDGGSDLNYPSITGHLNLSVRLVQKYKRTVTNVGEASSNYKVEVDEPRGVSVVVEPQILQFSRVNEKDYFVTLSINSSTKVGPMRRGSCVGCPTSTL
ncbi:Subtilisin-like protease [Acorus gramineus]|uniref:Subtilisin-like protease n=1 Tax=Acorus gramineus TaxID=55184 RepID=A0AAV9BD92_ACOGR|nr:Subtilisin-like protease [Acorus gramineus]